MASIGWEKTTWQSVARMVNHFDNERRKIANHSNKDIQPSLTDSNFIIGTDSFYSSVQKLKNRVSEVDEVLPPIRMKKDRKTVILMEVKCPETISNEREAEFFRRSYKLIEDKFGKENVAGGFVHMDEKHKYVDPHYAIQTVNSETNKTEITEVSVKRESLDHMHVMVTPFVPDKGVNAKAFMNPKKMQELNNLIDSMCRKEFGVDYMKGFYIRKGRSIKSLKLESEIAALKLEKEALIAERDEAIMYKHNAEIEADNAIKEAQKAINAAEIIKSESFSTVERAHNSIAAMQQEIKGIETAVGKAVRYLSRDDESEKIKFKNSIFGKETVEMPKELYDVMRTAVFASSAITALNDETKKSLKEMHETAIGKTVLEHEKTISDLSSELVDQRHAAERFRDGMENYGYVIERLIELIREIFEYLAPDLVKQFRRDLNGIIHEKDEFDKDR